MLKSLLSVFVIIFLLTSFAFAGSNNSVNIDNLSPQEKTLFFELQKKASLANQQSDAAAQIAKGIQDLKGIDVKSLTDWRVFITDTIKDICRDLNVSVNDFIKTPAGAGIAGLIIYKVAGKDILFSVVSKVFDIIFIIPFWIIIMVLILYFWRKYFTPVIVYEKIIEDRDEAGKVISVVSKKPVRKTSYPFQTSDSRQFMAGALIFTFILTNFITLMVIFVKG
jgi:hypothetical protein